MRIPLAESDVGYWVPSQFKRRYNFLHYFCLKIISPEYYQNQGHREGTWEEFKKEYPHRFPGGCITSRTKTPYRW